MSNIVDFFNRAIKPLKHKVAMMVARGVIKAIKDDKGIQLIQVSLLAGEVRDNIERFQEYGLTSNPPVGSEACVIFPMGNRDHGICIAIDNRTFRKKGLAEGEVALYNKEEIFLLLKTGGKLELKNSNEDFVTVLSDFLKAITDARVNTSLGPQALISQPPNASFTAIKTRLDTFKP